MIALSNYDKIDFGKLYIEQKSMSTFRSKSSKEWDKKSISMNKRVHKGTYVKDFISKMKYDKHSSVLDVGCGTGAIGLKLAKKAKSVLFCDYSKGMLKCTKENAKKLSLTNIEVKKLSFEDSFDDIKPRDIVVASRCLEVEDLKSVLQKLISKTKKRLYISYYAGRSFLGDAISEVLGETIEPRPDYIYLVNILYQLNYKAKVDFISHDDGRFNSDNFEEFLASVQWSYGKDLSKNDIKNLKNYFLKNISKKSTMDWAFIEVNV